MKVSKVFITVLVLGIFAIGAGALYMAWQQQLDRKDTLNASLDTTQALLPPINNSIASAQGELTAAQTKIVAARANLEAYKAKFPAPPPVAAIQSIDYGENLFIMAANKTLNLTEFHASEPSTTVISGIKCQSTNMDIKVSGYIVDINNFIGSLETAEKFLTATIESVDITFFTEFDQQLGAVPPPEATITINLLALEG
jgi:hypothetical protein